MYYVLNNTIYFIYISTKYLFSKSNYYTYYRKIISVKFILTQETREKKHGTIPENIVKNVKGIFYQRHHVQSYGTNRKKQIQHGGGRDVNMDKSPNPCLFLFP